MASYYRTIKGKKYDRALLELAESVTAGRGDGRISLQDARAILNKVKDGGEYSDTEKKTIQYIRDNFKFTDSADKWFREEIRKWAASKKAAGKKAPAKKAAKKPAPKKKTAAKKAVPKKKAAAKKAVPKKKTIPKKAAKKKATPKAAPVPEETYVSSVPEPSPILQQQEPVAEKQGAPWFKILLALAIIAAAAYLIHSLWQKSPAGKPETPAKIETDKSADVEKAEKKPDPEKAKVHTPIEITPEEITFKRIPPVVDSIESIKIYFAKGSGWINHKERKKLITIADYLKANPDKKLYIVGHACSLGTPKLNHDLSLYRARNAAKYLKLKGVPESSISLGGIGEKQPVKVNPTEKNLWQNRIIEFDVR